MALPAHARAWLRQRESGAVALTAIEDIWLWSERQGVFSHQTALGLHGLSDVLPSKGCSVSPDLDVDLQTMGAVTMRTQRFPSASLQ